MAFEQVEPFGGLVEDDRWAHQMALMATAAGAKARPEQYRMAQRAPAQLQQQDPDSVGKLFRSISRTWGNER